MTSMSMCVRSNGWTIALSAQGRKPGACDFVGSLQNTEGPYVDACGRAQQEPPMRLPPQEDFQYP